ncbi:DUF6538 domain-containing protein [Brevundimonas sp. LF-1]|uniref:DUF6538 domain-containing protein n=1 Tax=Brevundimonas sp. LF-1 TaxID=3126100 RepID=UPI0030E4EFE2
MAKHPDYLIARKGIFYYWRRVPEGLRHKPIFGGKAFFQKSLRVKTLKEARLKAATLGYDDLFEQHLHVPDSSPRHVVLTHPMLQQIAAARYERNLEALQSSRLKETAEDRENRDDYAIQQSAALHDPSSRHNARELLRRELDRIHRIEADWIIKKTGLEQDEITSTQLMEMLLEVEIKTLASRSDYALGHSFPTSPGFTVSSPSTAPRRAESHWSVKEVAEAAMAQNPSEASWEHKVRIASQMLDTHVGKNPSTKSLK